MDWSAIDWSAVLQAVLLIIGGVITGRYSKK